MPRVVVVSPYYNRAHLVDETVKAIRDQTYQDLEAYFVDDGSQDGTYHALLKYKSDKIRVSTQRNVGFTRTMISTIACTDSEFIAVQGSGDISYPTRLQSQVRFLDENPDVVAVGCYREVVSDIASRSYVVKPLVHKDIKVQLFNGNPFSQGEVLMRRSIYERAGGYRPFFVYRQDLDLWLRMTDYGSMAVVPEILYKAWKRKDSVTGDPRKLAVAMSCRDFALYCARERMAGRPDPLDTNGPISALMRPRSKDLATSLASEARRRALIGLEDDARHLLKAAFNEKPVISAWFTRVILFAPWLRPLAPLANRLMRLLKGWAAAPRADRAARSR
ncbi:glycosyltransferase family 2 protein [Rhizobium mongolense]|uniref:glycosyltransferase family 2 protein n=1 Tax=Rhizobium TaxID=379 RepID=UPI0024B280B1|nr:glycosyltransferase [Rhizobium sp. CC1099]WFU91662.1 glycosyltransferase [Rhizobium sp. CC1099]